MLLKGEACITGVRKHKSMKNGKEYVTVDLYFQGNDGGPLSINCSDEAVAQAQAQIGKPVCQVTLSVRMFEGFPRLAFQSAMPMNGAPK